MGSESIRNEKIIRSSLGVSSIPFSFNLMIILLCQIKLQGPGSTHSAHSALSGSIWPVLLGGGVVALWPGASLVYRVFL